MQSNETPLNYLVKISPRARYARLQMSVREGLVVIVPKGFDEGQIPFLLDKKRKWIQKIEKRFKGQREFPFFESTSDFPEQIHLRAIGENWILDYEARDISFVSVSEKPEKHLLVFGRTKSKRASKNALRRWISRKTHEHLAPWLFQLARENGFSVNRVMVRAQRSRWGSCSSRKTISLNLKLMFLPRPLVRYVLLHELAHTKVLNHSPRFWSQLSALEPDYKMLDKELRSAGRFVPAWV